MPKDYEQINPSNPVSEEDRKLLRSLVAQNAETIYEQQALTAAVRDVTESERQLRDEVSHWVGENLSDPGLPTRVQEDFMAKATTARERTLHVEELLQKPSFDFTRAATGEFWWAETTWNFDRGIRAEYLSDGLHFFDTAAYNGDPLIAFNAGATAAFELHPHRRPASGNGRYTSSPSVNLWGTISGFTGIYHPIWAADDKWAKCWMHLRQTAFQFTGSGPVILGERREHRTLINEENNGRTVHAPLPGFQPMPSVEFSLADPNASIWVHLEVRFDMQLEGWSCLSFSPQPNPMGSVLLQHSQWSIQPQ
ncbi:hypothetical protein P1P68_02700 [Streptomyces scabiei]|uniref:hypothetical protein n=1 Tax=Streptomyces scabiei TaxID=1930 RepID=UPI00298F92D4|nr:hypothetical protein [Streptomyces scabiei]MDW8803741.1 hypothetical protein [Streptomyces scabiei]